MGQHALPSPIALHKNICGPFLGAEVLSHECTLRTGYGSNYRAISINADPEIFGFHCLVRQGTRFDDLDEARTVNYFSIWVNDDPVIGDNSSKAFKIVLNDCLGEPLFEFQKLFFHVSSYALTQIKARDRVAFGL
jgi:hypothetical protein